MSHNLSGAIRCTVYRNADSLGSGVSLSIPLDMTLKQFLERCSMTLGNNNFLNFQFITFVLVGMNARRVFQVANGEEITHLYLIAPDESLIITEVRICE